MPQSWIITSSNVECPLWYANSNYNIAVQTVGARTGKIIKITNTLIIISIIINNKHINNNINNK